LTIYWTALVAVLGLLVFFAYNSGDWRTKMGEMGRIMFWTGLLAFLFHFADRIAK